jgi:hypothetical protein
MKVPTGVQVLIIVRDSWATMEIYADLQKKQRFWH